MKTCVHVVMMAGALAVAASVVSSAAEPGPAAERHAAVAPAEQAAGAAAANPLSAGAARSYGIIKTFLLKAAAKMPEDQYGFKPTADVRSFGQLIGHVADANYGFCSAVIGGPPPAGGFDEKTSIEKLKTTKADLEKALTESFAYCDKAHASMTDATAAQMAKFIMGEMPKLSILEFNTHHDFEHYGNIVTYMRLKNIVPPSSEPRKGND